MRLHRDELVLAAHSTHAGHQRQLLVPQSLSDFSYNRISVMPIAALLDAGYE